MLKDSIDGSDETQNYESYSYIIDSEASLVKNKLSEAAALQ
jgi:hypothetical protein